MTTPTYWKAACRTLSRDDAVIKRLIATHRHAVFQSRGDPFYTMMRGLVGQQISVKAADTIWGRLETLTKKVTPNNVSKVADQALREIGFSARKVEYARTLQEFFKRRNTMRYWHDKADEVVMAELVALRGVGRWTAEMFLMFCLCRPNIFPVDDLGLLKAIARHYHNGKMPTKAQLAMHQERWQPYCTVATWYLWRSLDPVDVVY
jgi:DNA-3-methyladenine glycosylase II